MSEFIPPAGAIVSEDKQLDFIPPTDAIVSDGEEIETEEVELVGEVVPIKKEKTVETQTDKPAASIMVGGNRVYLNEVIQSLQDQDDRPLDVQTKEYKDKVIDITKNSNLSQEQKDSEISNVLKPSYLTLKSGTGDEDRRLKKEWQITCLKVSKSLKLKKI